MKMIIKRNFVISIRYFVKEMENAAVRYMDTYTVYVESGVATQEQVIGCMKKAIGEAEKILKVKDSCKFKVNLILDKEGKYFGFGYIRVSNPKIYWMLLGKNPDGSERVEERVDPNWKMPTHPNEGLSIEQILDKNKNKSWFDISKEDDIFVQPKIKVVLPPLVTIPGFLYDKEQIAHLKELQQEEQEEGQEQDEFEDPAIIEKKLQTVNLPDIPNIGYFEIPVEAFKSIFSFFLSSESTKEKVSVRLGNKDIKDTYPIVNFVESKNAGKIVFVTFDPNTKDAIFALLMTKKTHITNPKNPTQKTTLIFMHAFDNQRSRN
jgi:hypothetical protein